MAHAIHPHKYVLNFVHALDGSEELQQMSWNMVNDRCAAQQRAAYPHGSWTHAVSSAAGQRPLRQAAQPACSRTLTHRYPPRLRLHPRSMRTTLCVRFKGHVIAAGAIYLAARRLQVRPRARPAPSSSCLTHPAA